MLVSVIVPNYNHEKYLLDRFESIFNQTFNDFEVIILDDDSNDHSQNIIEKYRGLEKVTHCIINEKNSGSTFEQWNKGIELAQGKYIWIAESDDISDNSFLEKMLSKINSDNNIGLCFCESNRMDSNGKVTGDWTDWTKEFNPKYFDKDFIVLGSEFIKDCLIYKNVIPNASAVIFKKELYEKVGGANKALKTNGDWDIWFKMCAYTKVAFISNKLNYFRYHSQSVIAKEVSRDKAKLSLYMLELRYGFKIFLMNNNILNNRKILRINSRKINKAIVKFSYFYYSKSQDKKILIEFVYQTGLILFLIFTLLIVFKIR